MISLTVLVKNGEETLEKTLASAVDFPEVVLFDTGSTDRTLEIARKFPNVKIVHGTFDGFGKTHNAATAAASYDWILSLDSDEVLSPEIIREIQSLTLDPSCVYSLPRKNFFNNKHIKGCAGWHPDRIVRLYHRKRTSFNEAEVHEKIIADGLRIVPLKGSISHTPYRSFSDFLHKMQAYSSLYAKQHAGHKKSSLGKALLHGWVGFLKSYVLKKGFLFGEEGFLISLYNGQTAFYKYMKLKEENKKIK